MICNKCGSENREGAKFCNECGSLLESEIPEIVVPDDDPIEKIPQTVPVVDQETRRFEVIKGEKADPDFEEFVQQDQEVDGFDFAPIEVEKLQEESPVFGETEEVVVGASYQAPQPAWGAGDTMKMPRVEGQPAENKKEFLAADDSTKKRMGRSKKILIAVLVILVLLVGGASAAIFIDLPDGTNIADEIGLGAILGGKKVPNVTGQTKAEATSLLADKGFTVKVREVKSDENEDTVLLTDPHAGSRLPEGEAVVLQVATARKVPAIEGESIESAQGMLSSEGLTHVQVVHEKSNEPEGTVLRVSPEADTKVVSTSEITVVVAEPYRVPEVVGMAHSQAVETLEAEGYQVYVVYVYSEQAEGTVVSTDPAAGTEHNAGEFVTISLSKSRASELVDLTRARYGSGESFSLSGTSYWVSSIDSAEYIGNDTVSCLITCSISYTTPTGETLTGETRQRAFTVSFDSNNNSSIYAS